MACTTVSIPASVLESMTQQLDNLQRKEHKARFQVVLLIEDEKGRDESHHWTHFKETAYGMARSLRERHPGASRVVVYDHQPTSTEF